VHHLNKEEKMKEKEIKIGRLMYSAREIRDAVSRAQRYCLGSRRLLGSCLEQCVTIGDQQGKSDCTPEGTVSRVEKYRQTKI